MNYPSTWETVTIGESLDLINGRAFKPNEWTTSGRPIIRIQNLNNPKAAFNYYAKDLPAKFSVATGDLLFAWSGTPGTSFGAHVWKGPDAWLNQHIFKVVFPAKVFDKAFLQFAINQNLAQYIGVAHGGAGLAHITKGKFEASQLPLPPLSEQKRIVAKIEELFSELEAGEESLRVARRQLGVYRQSLLKQAFEGKLTAHWRTQNPAKLESPATLLARIQSARQSRYEQQLEEWNAAMREWEKSGKSDKKPPRPTLSPSPKVTNGDYSIPESWTWTNLGNLKLFSLYGPRFSSDDYTEGGVCVLRTSDIGESGKVNLATAPRLKLSRTELYQYRCDKGDLLITRTGSLGTLAVFNDDVDSIPGAYLIHYRLASADYAAYLYHFLKGPVGQAALTGGGAGIGRPNLNAPTIEAIPIPLCSLPEQQEIVRVLDEQFEGIERNEREIDGALRSSEALRQAILQKAFTGRLVPQDPTDEPATTLLARLRAEQTGASSSSRASSSASPSSSSSSSPSSSPSSSSSPAPAAPSSGRSRRRRASADQA